MQKLLYLLDYYDYFLFDFDGLILNSEPLHFQAYSQAFLKYNIVLSKDFAAFIHMAHTDSNWLKTLEQNHTKIAGKIQAIKKLKDSLFETLIRNRAIELMPGVEAFLTKLQEKGKPSCVVTNSQKKHVALMKAPHEILNTIENWVCREDYLNPKPAADGYLRAKQFHPTLRCVGFEDTIKGLNALNAAHVKPVLVSKFFTTTLENSLHIKSFFLIIIQLLVCFLIRIFNPLILYLVKQQLHT